MKKSTKIWAAITLMTTIFFIVGCDLEDDVNQGNHNYVNLGLPSGTAWATCNVGADSPMGYGNYYAWGETESKSIYNLGSYIFSEGDSFNKYSIGDFLTVLEPSDDVASVSWGSEWSVPTKEQWEELLQYTTKNWIVQNGIEGLCCTAENGNSIFFQPPVSLRMMNPMVLAVLVIIGRARFIPTLFPWRVRGAFGSMVRLTA